LTKMIARIETFTLKLLSKQREIFATD
jgi:hypothetical protein